MLKITPKLAANLPATDVNNRKVVSSSDRNDRKSAKSNFTKLVRGVEKPSFLTPDTRRVFTQLRQLFTKALIIQHFNPKHHIRIKTNASSYIIGGIFS